jgi:hypothetical protein
MPDLAEILHQAESRGYTHNFEVDAGALRCKTLQPAVNIDGLHVEDSLSVAHGSNPGDDATVLLLRTANGEKGYLILASPFYVDPESRALVDRLRSLAP